jgi:hypothetical protein
MKAECARISSASQSTTDREMRHSHLSPTTTLGTIYHSCIPKHICYPVIHPVRETPPTLFQPRFRIVSMGPKIAELSKLTGGAPRHGRDARFLFSIQQAPLTSLDSYLSVSLVPWHHLPDYLLGMKRYVGGTHGNASFVAGSRLAWNRCAACRSSLHPAFVQPLSRNCSAVCECDLRAGPN